MRAVICYRSYHHRNTYKLVQAIAQAYPVDLVDLKEEPNPDLAPYDLVGLASGIYGFDFDPLVIDCARRLPAGKTVFFLYTYAGAKGHGTKTISKIVRERGCSVAGEYSCRGYNTFGPFRLIGGTGKGLPGEAEMLEAQKFFSAVVSGHRA